MATTAAVKNLPNVVKAICCLMLEDIMTTEEQMRSEFERVLQGQNLYGNTVMHYFALCKNDVAIRELLRLGGCMCIRCMHPQLRGSERHQCTQDGGSPHVRPQYSDRPGCVQAICQPNMCALRDGRQFCAIGAVRGVRALSGL